MPETITPNGDGQSDAATVSYRLTVAANVTVEVVDAAGVTVATAVDRIWTRPGKHTATVDGVNLPDGMYDILVRARTPVGLQVEKSTSLRVSRTLGVVSVTPDLFSPNGDGRNDRLQIGFELTVAAEVSIRILRDGRWVASPHDAIYEAGAHSFEWNGARAAGRLRDGSYSVVVEVSDEVVGAISAAVPFTSDTTAPRVRLLPASGIRVSVSEPAVLYLTIDGARMEREVKRAGVVRIPWSGAVRRVRVVARDAAGNTSSPVIRLRDSSLAGE